MGDSSDEDEVILRPPIFPHLVVAHIVSTIKTSMISIDSTDGLNQSRACKALYGEMEANTSPN
jgi:hypothetical protein